MTKRGALVNGTAAARSASAAVAAAATELRPVDIVGVYEAQREAAEAELALLRQEVGGRHHAGQGNGAMALHCGLWGACRSRSA